MDAGYVTAAWGMRSHRHRWARMAISTHTSASAPISSTGSARVISRTAPPTSTRVSRTARKATLMAMPTSRRTRDRQVTGMRDQRSRAGRSSRAGELPDPERRTLEREAEAAGGEVGRSGAGHGATAIDHVRRTERLHDPGRILGRAPAVDRVHLGLA